jgi:pimeloyl-ACP methyl ester carboxylesterase/2-polyprenyl-6-methoxyphenol hydroxylase-like FAD-dependent oxidoreductase
MKRLGEQAVVIGGSVAGVLAAAALADHYERVTVLERDALPAADEQRRAVPQGRHGHVLLGRGLEALDGLLPEIGEEMIAAGAPTYVAFSDAYFAGEGFELARAAVGKTAITASRPFFEGHMRRRALALPNVELRERWEALALSASADRGRVTGVKARDAEGREELLEADLVVVASGRSARLPAWLEELGYERPPESTLRIDLGYCSRIYRLAPGALADKLVFVAARPGLARGMGLFAQEGDRWLLTLAGLGEEKPPADPEGFERFLASVAPPHALAALREGEPLGEIATYGFPAHLRRHYERMRRFPAGLLPIGDAICSFNPTFGQGMTVAALEAEALRGSLARGERSLYRRHSRAAAKIVDPAWDMATRTDLALPEVKGKRTLADRIVIAYTRRMRERGQSDGEVAAALALIAGMIERPTYALRPSILRRVLAGRKPESTVWPGRPLATPVERRTLRVDGIATPLREAGPREASEAVVFIHGVPGSGADFEPLVSAAGQLGRAVSWDAPGFGKADKPDGFDQSVDGHAAFIGRALEELGVERAHLVLHDFGGPWGLGWAIENPERFASVTLICTGVPIDYRWHRTARLWRTPLAGELAMATLTRTGFGANLRRSGPRPLPGPLVDKMFEDLDSDTRRAILRLYRSTDDPAGEAPRLVEALRPLDRPALVIWGKSDPYLPASLAQRQLQAFPSADVHRLEDSGHWPFVDRSERTEELLVEHLRQVIAPAEEPSRQGGLAGEVEASHAA